MYDEATLRQVAADLDSLADPLRAQALSEGLTEYDEGRLDGLDEAAERVTVLLSQQLAADAATDRYRKD